MPIRKTYAYHKPSPEGAAKLATLRQAFSNLEQLIEDTTVRSRNQALAFTTLQEASMWANKAIVMDDPGSVVVQPEEDALKPVFVENNCCDCGEKFTRQLKECVEKDDLYCPECNQRREAYAIKVLTKPRV